MGKALMFADHLVLPFNCMPLVTRLRCPLSVSLARSVDMWCCDRSTSTASCCCASLVRQGCHGNVARWVSMPSDASLLPGFCCPLTIWWYSLAIVASTTCLVACLKACSCCLRVCRLSAAPPVVCRGSGCPSILYSAYSSSHVMPLCSWSCRLWWLIGMLHRKPWMVLAAGCLLHRAGHCSATMIC